MIDFKNSEIFKLTEVKLDTYAKIVNPLLVSGEIVNHTFQTIRDGVVFTNKRLIIINVQGVTGKKKDVISLPYNKIHAFSVETTGVFDIDSEVELWFSEIGKIKLEFSGGTDVVEICKTISDFALR